MDDEDYDFERDLEEMYRWLENQRDDELMEAIEALEKRIIQIGGE